MIHASLKAKSNLSSAGCLMQMHYLLRRESARGSTVNQRSAFCASVQDYLTSISPKNPGGRGN